MTLPLSAMLGLQTRFRVTVDGINLGGWSKCSGLTVEFKSTPVKEGGNYDYQTILADCIEYKPITLERAMNAAESAKVQGWLRSKVSGWMNAMQSGGGATAKITLLDSHLHDVSSWSLRNVYPAKWDGPDLSTSTFGIAVEKLTLVHEGFL
jgi:phage tail-like protein